MKLRLMSLILLLPALTLQGSFALGQDATEIISKMDNVLYAPSDMTGTHTIVLVDRNGNEETREAYIKQKGTDKRLMRFTAPASQAGIAVLALPDDVMYMYLPAFGRERRISASVKNQNFAGTDFTYEDMEPVPYADKYNVKLLETTADSYVVEMTPKSRSDYSKVVATIHKTAYYPVSMEYFDQGNNKVKVAEYTFEKVDKYWSTKEIRMTNLKKDHQTIMRMSDVKYDTGLGDDEFTVRRLKQ